MPGMLAIVTRLFFIMGHGSLEVRLEVVEGWYRDAPQPL